MSRIDLKFLRTWVGKSHGDEDLISCRHARLAAGYAEEISGCRLREFSYRGLSPALLGNSITINADVRGDCVTLHAALDDGTICMKAEAFTS